MYTVQYIYECPCALQCGQLAKASLQEESREQVAAIFDQELFAQQRAQSRLLLPLHGHQHLALHLAHLRVQQHALVGCDRARLRHVPQLQQCLHSRAHAALHIDIHTEYARRKLPSSRPINFHSQVRRLDYIHSECYSHSGSFDLHW